MNKKYAKKLFTIAVIIYVASFLIINWNDVSWIFNYKEVSGLVSDFFNPYPGIDASSFSANFYPNHSSVQVPEDQTLAASAPGEESNTHTQEAKTTYTDKNNSIEIPKISISAPIVFPAKTDKDSVTKDLDRGVVYYPGSVYPGQKGQAVILGHSAPPNWPKIKYDWVFNDLDKLEVGYIILVNLNNKQYKYVVKRKDIIDRGANPSMDGLNLEKNILTLVTCWPPGKDYQRIAVSAELQKE